MRTMALGWGTLWLAGCHRGGGSGWMQGTCWGGGEASLEQPVEWMEQILEKEDSRFLPGAVWQGLVSLPGWGGGWDGV